jgi:GNAT superfamily N-acetyltransferase
MRINPDDIIIRPLEDSDSIEELTDLLHRGYKVLAEMGLRYLATHQDAAMTKERIAKGGCFVATHRGRIIGTITFRSPSHFGGSSWLKRDGVGKFGQFAVDPDYQSNGIGTRMMAFVEDHARSKGFAEICLDTSEKATHLIDWYKKLGYRFIEYVNWDITNYRSVILSKSLTR